MLDMLDPNTGSYILTIPPCLPPHPQHMQYMSPDPIPHGVASFPMQSPPLPGYPSAHQYPGMLGSPANPAPMGGRPEAAPASAPSGPPPVQNDKCEHLFSSIIHDIRNRSILARNTVLYGAGRWIYLRKIYENYSTLCIRSKGAYEE